MKIVVFFLTLFITVTIYGQADFSGTWKLNHEKSQFNKVDPSSTTDKLEIDQQSGTITIQRNERTKRSLKIDSTAEIEIAVDGGNKTRVSMKLTPDKKGLIETRTYIYAEGQSGLEAKKTSTWTLSEDKKTLIIEYLVELNDGQPLEMRLIYDRQ